MQNYIALRIDATPCNETVTDLLAAFLGDVGFESFSPDDNGLTAYITTDAYNPDLVNDILNDFPIDVKFSMTSEEIEGEDWNQEWEKNYFKPIVIGDQVVVHSSFHNDVPSAEYDIIIDPKMAFGTGHHSTTSQMMKHILEADIEGKAVIDMGTGTGILSILAKMRGAGKVTGIEIDPFACDNAKENVELNKTNINIVCGDASALENLEPADIFLANINRNIITGDIDRYAGRIKQGGKLYLSGFYENDIPVIMEAASPQGFSLEKVYTEKDWAAIKLVKKN